MAKRGRKKASRKSSKRRTRVQKKGKINVKHKFKNAIAKLKRMSAKKQREAVSGSSNEFIKDMSTFLKRIRTKPHLLGNKHRKILKRHKTKLRKIINSKTPLSEKRRLLTQKGGIIPALIPIITAIIGAAGGIGASAVGAAIMKA